MKELCTISTENWIFWGFLLWVVMTGWGGNWPRLLQVPFYGCELKPQRALFPGPEELLPLPISKDCSPLLENSAGDALREEKVRKFFFCFSRTTRDQLQASWERPREEFNLQCFCHALLAPAIIHCSPGPRQKGCRGWSDL